MQRKGGRQHNKEGRVPSTPEKPVGKYRPCIHEELQTAANLEQPARAVSRSESGEDKDGVDGATEANGTKRV